MKEKGEAVVQDCFCFYLEETITCVQPVGKPVEDINLNMQVKDEIKTNRFPEYIEGCYVIGY